VSEKDLGILGSINQFAQVNSGLMHIAEIANQRTMIAQVEHQKQFLGNIERNDKKQIALLESISSTMEDSREQQKKNIALQKESLDIQRKNIAVQAENLIVQKAMFGIAYRSEMRNSEKYDNAKEFRIVINRAEALLGFIENMIDQGKVRG
jgi:hypothetical protein